MITTKPLLFTGNSNPSLAKKLATRLFVDLGKCVVDKFSDGEVKVQINENVRGQTVFVIQSTCSPTNDNLMELLIMVDALRRSAAGRIIAVIPYYGYARQDRRPDFDRTPITSSLVASMLETAGINQLVTFDIHSGQQQGFFNIPVTNISASTIIVDDILNQHNIIDSDNLVIVSPDVGGVGRARYIAKRTNNADLAIIDKRREHANQSKVMNIIGNVEGAHCVLIDDMIDTAGTLCGAAKALKNQGAKVVSAYATHPVFSGQAYQNIGQSCLDQVVITDTIPLDHNKIVKYNCDDKIRQLSVVPLISEIMHRMINNQSVSAIYE